MTTAECLATEIAFCKIIDLGHWTTEVSRAYGAKRINEGAWIDLMEAIDARRKPAPPEPTPSLISAPAVISVTRRRPPRQYDQQRALERKRRQSMGGRMPPGLGCRFTEGERAVLNVIATEIRRDGKCELYIDAIASRAGRSRSTTKNAIREAKRLCLIEVQDWKQAPDWNGPNCIRIVSPEWLTWLAHGQTEMTVKKLTTNQNQKVNRSRSAAGSRVFHRQNGEGGDRGSAEKRLSEVDSAKAVPGGAPCPM